MASWSLKPALPTAFPFTAVHLLVGAPPLGPVELGVVEEARSLVPVLHATSSLPRFEPGTANFVIRIPLQIIEQQFDSRLRSSGTVSPRAQLRRTRTS